MSRAEQELLYKPSYVDELLRMIHQYTDTSQDSSDTEQLLEQLADYHENDIAEALQQLSADERKILYPILGVERLAEIIPYMDHAGTFLEELDPQTTAQVLSEMDSDDAVDVLETMNPTLRSRLAALLETDAREDLRMLLSYADDEIGSKMTTNYVAITRGLTIRQAMHELIHQAGENDNILTVYVVDEQGKFYGAIDLTDLIIARENDTLDKFISRSYPYVTAHERMEDCVERIKDYAEDSIPVLSDDGYLIGAITAQDIIEFVDEELGEDYAKLAGLTESEDLDETPMESVKKRLPWLVILLFLGMGVSSVVGVFESVVAVIPIVICFQSLILDMAGNVGTQSLAVTIRVLVDEHLTGKQKFFLVIKEAKVGLLNGLFLALLAFVFVGCYTYVFKYHIFTKAFLISGCVGISLLVAMIISSLVGTLVPMMFHKIHIDPAVASGPLITTMNDLVAVLTYYGLAWLMLIKICPI